MQQHTGDEKMKTVNEYIVTFEDVECIVFASDMDGAQ